MKKYLLFILAMLLLLAFSTSAFASEPIGMIEEAPIEYPFTEPYEYPIVPGTDEWRELTSLAEKIEVCHIPQMALDNMTTEALLETVMNYPLLINMFVYDSPQMGFEAVMDYCNGLQELWDRPDLEEVLDQFISEESYSYDEIVALKQRLFIEILLDALQGPSLSALQIMPWTLHHDYTPNGTRVQFLYNSTWEDHGFASEEAWLNQCEILYDSNCGEGEEYETAEKKRDADASYNCHSYSFYSRGTGNKYWLQPGQAQLYISDGSYTKVACTDDCPENCIEVSSEHRPQVGDIVCWRGMGHSGVVHRISEGRVFVRSKWNYGGLYEHDVADGPFNAEIGLAYYR